ncbi:sensor histidine kinase [Hyalangium rubrum]|uniref:histidine kinase n=1 Tax=Hyalangium rubrum TaxID=3103134 RepID=A0ABU5HJF8_9BACT|nr:ATP-binding protein [Hyalangium sp. s54d21]MDY7232978.1 ATP-binding protein [Hyalangium sp. s54d21]
MGAILFNLALIIQFWGHWDATVVLVTVLPVMMLLNFLFIERLAKWTSRDVAETVRMIASGLSFVVYGPFVNWSVILWLYVPLNMIWLHGPGGRERTRAFFYLLLTNGAAIWAGCDPWLPVAFDMLGIISFLIAEQRTALLQSALQKVIQQQDELRQVHQRALEQEKLSSLGMMAAGVAHEINNPMSFVTSNIHSLYDELKQQTSLSKELKEYVDEVLPMTLDGVQRVNDIVADLRRFSRGDPEAYVEYDLNAEAQTALRIAHNQLLHCQVETHMEEVGRLMGRPRQIGQVLLNLLVNAGQATNAGGKVSLSTRQEGEGVFVQVRDTGAGMSPETMRKLFQPFFTTKAPGMGTGLGLAVVHGIVTAHGGRIDVQSRPGEGSCFTVYLPRTPPRTESMVTSPGSRTDLRPIE